MDRHNEKQYCHYACPLCLSIMPVRYAGPWTCIMAYLEFFAKNFPRKISHPLVGYLADFVVQNS